MNVKKWIRNWVITIILIVSIIGGINYVVDPLWCFGHSNKFNSKQDNFNERQQKTNYINFNNLDKYDGVLLGSSRTAYINQNDFNNMNIYNYASNAMKAFEYKGYIDFFKRRKGTDLKYIIIGSDFFVTNVPKKKFNAPKFYISNSESILYRYKMLFSIDTLKHSSYNIEMSLKGMVKYYDRDNVKHQQKVSEKKRLKRHTKSLIKLTDSFTGKKYTWNKEYEKILRQIKLDNPNTKFLIFSSPVTADLLVSIIKTGKRINEYERWLRLMIDVFGQVHHYMTINSITSNLENYPDSQHYYPHIGKLLAHKLSGLDNKKIPADFGVTLNKNNIDEFLKKFREKIKHYNSPIDRIK